MTFWRQVDDPAEISVLSQIASHTGEARAVKISICCDEGNYPARIRGGFECLP